MDKYYVIETFEDGDVSLNVYNSKEECLNGVFEDLQYMTRPPKCKSVEEVQSRNDLLASDGIIIIKGKQVVPKPKTVVKEYELE